MPSGGQPLVAFLPLLASPAPTLRFVHVRLNPPCCHIWTAQMERRQRDVRETYHRRCHPAVQQHRSTAPGARAAPPAAALSRVLYEYVRITW